MSKNVEFGIILKASGGQAVVADARAAREGLRGIKSEADQATASTDKLSEGIKRVGQFGIAYLGVTQITSYGREILNTAVAQDRFNATLAVATGDARNAGAEYIYLENLSRRLGLEIQSTAATYASWTAASRGTSLEGERSRAVFASVSNVVARMNLNADQSGGVFLALTQMMSKGVVSAEEFRQQLGERLPIATTAGARAMGVTTGAFVELLNSGKLISEDFLPKFARALDELSGGSGPVDNLQASLNRLDSDFTKIRQNLGQQVPIKFVVDGADMVLSNANAVSASITGVIVAATAYGTIKMGSWALEAVVGIQAKSSALAVERAATLAAAQAEVERTAIQLASARSNTMLAGGTATLTAATNAHTAALARQATAQAAMTASTGIARGAMMLMGGPIGAITLALGVGAAAWSFWGSSAKDAAKEADAALAAAKQRAIDLGISEKQAIEEDLAKARAERDRLRNVGAPTAKIKAADDTAWKLAAELELIAKREKNQAEAQIDSTAWNKLHQTKSARQTQELAELNAAYLKQVDVQTASQEQMLRLAAEYEAKKSEILKKYKKDADPNDTAVSAIEADAWKKQMEVLKVSAAQIKVYELAVNGATKVQIDSAQAAADQIDRIDAETRSREGLIKAAERQASLQSSLSSERAGLAEVNGQNVLSDPNLEGDARIEAERVIAQASEDAKYQVQTDAIARETEALLRRGELTEGMVATQARRMEVLAETHEQRKLAISMRYMTSEEQFRAMSWKQQVSVVASEMENMTKVGATKSRAMFELNKLASKANVVVSGVQAAQDSYKFGAVWGGPFGGAAMAALSVANTAAQLAAINSATFGGGSSTPASVGASGGIPSQMTQTAQPVSSADSGTQQASVPALSLSFTVQALDPSAITDETYRKIADSLAPVIQQTFGRNAQVAPVMI